MSYFDKIWKIILFLHLLTSSLAEQQVECTNRFFFSLWIWILRYDEWNTILLKIVFFCFVQSTREKKSKQKAHMKYLTFQALNWSVLFVFKLTEKLLVHLRLHAKPHGKWSPNGSNAQCECIFHQILGTIKILRMEVLINPI